MVKVPTTTGGMQAGDGLIEHRLRRKVHFPDTNKVTYLEKILIRRLKRSTLKLAVNECLHQQTPGVHEEEQEEIITNISSFNIFTDEEDVVRSMSDVIPDDFNGISPSTGIVIGDMFINEDRMNSCEAIKIHNDTEYCGQQVQCLKKVVSCFRPKEKHRLRQKNVEKRLSNEVGLHSSKRRKPKDKTSKSNMPHGDTTHQLSQSALVASVQSAQSQCIPEQTPTQCLASFFFHAVQPTVSSDENPVTPSPALVETSHCSGEATFSLGHMWLPHSSVALNNETSDKIEDLSYTPQKARECRDAYYDDCTTDSEPENEREVFLSSRRGTVHESTGFGEDDRAASSYEELEGEELERDRADCDTLAELVRELQVSSMLDGGKLVCQREAREN